jgi:hypothetical protein
MNTERMESPLWGHHPKFEQCCHVDRETVEQLRTQVRSLHGELNRLEWRDEHVYHTLARNSMASWAIVDQLMPLLPKHNEQAACQVKQLYVLLKATMIIGHVLVQEAGKCGQEIGHRRCLWSQSLRKDSTNSSLSSGKQHSQNRDERYLRDII